MYDNENNLFYEINNLHESTYTKLDSISENIIKTVIEIEDKRFYNHSGFDIYRIGKALINNLGENETIGASTITQQYIKNIYLTNEKTIKRADEVGLGTIVCADTVEDVKKIAMMGPNLIVAEPTELIGTGKTSDTSYVTDTIKMVNEINPDIMVLQGAGISNGTDVYNMIKCGAQATGSTSGIIKAADPYAMVEEMLYNLRKAGDELNA